MLGKLIKYEFKSTSRIMWFLYGALIIVGALLGFMFRIGESSEYGTGAFSSLLGYGDNNVFTTVTIILVSVYGIMVQAIFIMTIVMIVTRFYKNLLGGEGYLMHTLPVKTHNLVLSKTIVAIIWYAIAVIAGILSGMLFALTSGILEEIIKNMSWGEFTRIVKEILTTNSILGMVMIVISAITGALGFYFAMSIGNIANKNKFLYSVLAYVGIQIIVSVVFSVIGMNQGGVFGVILNDGNMTNFLIGQIIQQSILGVAFFFGTNYILKNKLNLA